MDTLTRFCNRLALTTRTLIKGSPQTTGERQIRPLTPAEVEEARTFFPLDKYFIFGHARSGTTMLTRLIRLHPNVHCNYQAHFFTRPPLLQALVADPQVAEWLERRSNRWNRGVDLSPVVLRAAADFILEREARKQGAHIVGDKSPNSLLDGRAVELAHRVYPDAHLIYIVRDGRDAAISHRFQTFIDKTEHLTKDDLRIRQAFSQDPEPFLNGERSIFSQTAIRQAAKGWARNVIETSERGRSLYGKRYISLRYEDLLARPWEEIERLWSFLGAGSNQNDLQTAVQAEMERNPDAEWQQQKAKEIAEPLQKGKRGNWRQILTAGDKQIFEEICGETLRAWGYPE